MHSYSILLGTSVLRKYIVERDGTMNGVTRKFCISECAKTSKPLIWTHSRWLNSFVRALCADAEIAREHGLLRGYRVGSSLKEKLVEQWSDRTRRRGAGS